jgi:hypothetical protein
MVCFDGAGLLVVYADPNGKYIEYWVSEGADELNSHVARKTGTLFIMLLLTRLYVNCSDLLCSFLSSARLSGPLLSPELGE